MSVPDYIYQVNYSQAYLDYLQFTIEHTTISGAVNFLVAGIEFLIYVRILMIIIVDKDLYSLPAYKIIVHLGVADICELIVHCASGLYMLFMIDYDNKFVFWIGKISGSIITFGWLASALLTMLLAINRFFQMIFAEYVDEVFSAIKLKIYFVICWLISAVIPIICLTPFISRLFFPHVGAYRYNGIFQNNYVPWLFFDLDSYWMLGFILLATSIYAIIIISLIFQKCQHQQQNASYDVELRLTLQTAISCLYGTFVVVYIQWIEPQLPFNYYSVLASTMIWIVLSGFNSIIYLIFNKTIRDKFLPEKIRKLHTIKSQTVQVMPMRTIRSNIGNTMTSNNS